MSPLYRSVLPLLLCLCTTPFTALAADSPNTHPPANPKVRAILADLGKVQSVGQTSLSPDGKRLAWTERGHSGPGRIMVSEARGEGAEQLDIGKDCTASDPQWSPDSRALLFAGDCGQDGQTDLFVTTLKGQPQQITHLKGFVEHPAWSPDGERIAFLYVPGATRPAGALAAMKPPSGVIGVEGLEIQRIGVIETASSTFRQVSPEKLHVFEYDWAPDGQHLAYVAAPPPGENNWWKAQLYTQSLKDADAKSILDPAHADGSLHGLQIAVPRWS